MGHFEPFCLVSKIVPLIFPGLYHLTNHQTVDETKAPHQWLIQTASLANMLATHPQIGNKWRSHCG
jgi:hypothetical protein